MPARFIAPKALTKSFPRRCFGDQNRAPQFRWIFNRCADGRGVVTPRDVLDLLLRAKQKQQDLYLADPEGTSEYIIGPAANQYGFEELSKRKREIYLEAEFTPPLEGNRKVCRWKDRLRRRCRA
jgi:hypothetical protein